MNKLELIQALKVRTKLSKQEAIDVVNMISGVNTFQQVDT